MDKKKLRKEIAIMKSRYTPQELRSMSSSICSQLLCHPIVNAAKTILLYWSMDDEVCTHELVRKLASMEHCVLLPRVSSDTKLTIHRYTSDTDLSPGSFGIMEPTTPPLTDEECRALLNMSAIAVVPGVAFDTSGHRLGRGRGYYDRLLKDYEGIYKIGICFPFQMLASVPYDEYDVVMDEVVSGEKKGNK